MTYIMYDVATKTAASPIVLANGDAALYSASQALGMSYLMRAFPFLLSMKVVALPMEELKAAGGSRHGLLSGNMKGMKECAERMVGVVEEHLNVVRKVVASADPATCRAVVPLFYNLIYVQDFMSQLKRVDYDLCDSKLHLRRLRADLQLAKAGIWHGKTFLG